MTKNRYMLQTPKVLNDGCWLLVLGLISTMIKFLLIYLIVIHTQHKIYYLRHFKCMIQ